jgi:hypothetical protein
VGVGSFLRGAHQRAIDTAMGCVRLAWVTVALLAGCGANDSQGPASNDASEQDIFGTDRSAQDDTSREASSPDAAEASPQDGSSSRDAVSSQEGSLPLDGSTGPFTDPNPLPCVNMDPTALCLMGWPDNNHTFTGCCLTNFPQNPQGKCGVLSGSSACVERKAPGNADSKCMGGNFDVSFGSFSVGGSGVPGCCQWRTGTCGVAAGDLGCIDYAETFFRGKPCTPDYANGSSYP